MCDYSLENVLSRPAAVADALVVTSFPNTITRGFAAADDMHCAVCLMPGTELAFERPVEYEHPVTHRRTTMNATTARFREVDPYVAHVHHDALEFPDGTILLLTRLLPGQRASVLQLPAKAWAVEAAATQPVAEQESVSLAAI